MKARNKKFQKAFIDFFNKLMDDFSQLREEDIPKEHNVELIFNDKGHPQSGIVESVYFHKLIQQRFYQFVNWPEYRDLKQSVIFVDAAGKRFKDRNAFQLNNNFIPSIVHKLHQDSGNTFHCNNEIIQNQYKKVENGIYKKYLLYSVKVPLFNIGFEAQKIRLGKNVNIIKTSENDHKLFFRLWGSAPYSFNRYYDNLKAIIAIEAPKKHGEPMSIPTLNHWQLFTSIAISLSIFKKAPIYYGSSCVQSKNFWRVFEGVMYTGLMNISANMLSDQTKILKRNEVEEYIAFWKRLKKAIGLNSWLEIACKRLLEYHHKFTNKRSDPDQLIDLMIILEILYLPTSEGELKFRLSTTCAKVLGTNLEEIKDIYNKIKLAYDVRSDLVHDGQLKGSSKKKLKKYNLTVFDLIRSVESYTYDSLHYYIYNPQKRNNSVDILLK